MFERIKENSVAIFSCAVLFVCGVVVGVYLKEDAGGKYITLKWTNDVEILSVGNSNYDVGMLDLNALKDSQISIMVDKIKTLNSGVLAKEIVKIVDSGGGAFARPEVEVDIRFVESPLVVDAIAMACPASPLYGQRISMFRVLTAAGIEDANRVKNFEVVSRKDFGCSSDTVNTVWVDEKAARKWLGVESIDSVGTVKVKAKLLSSLLTV